MAIHVENIGGGGGKAPPNPVGTQSQAIAETFADGNNVITESFRTGFSTQYIGSDSPNTGLLLSQTSYLLKYTPSGVPTPGYSFQSGVVTFPWKLAWYTQIRHTHQSTGTAVNFDLTEYPGLTALSMLTCFSGNTGNTGQCYALTASTYGDRPHRIRLQIQKWVFPNVPLITGGTAPNTNWIPTNLLECGDLEYNDARLFFIATDRTTHWQLTAYVVYNDNNPDYNHGVWDYIFMGSITDGSIGAGMPGFAAIQFSSFAPIYLRGAWVGGQGPNDGWMNDITPVVARSDIDQLQREARGQL